MIDRRDFVTMPSGRVVAIESLAPATGATRRAIVFSHGANAAPDRYRALLAGWVAAGHGVIAPLHLDSEDHPDRETQDHARVLRTRIEDMARTVEAVIGGHLAIPGLTAPASVVAAGHSYGAYVAQIMAGATAPDRDTNSQPSIPGRGAIRAIVALSPPPVLDGLIPAGSWAHLSAPMLVQTGDVDVMPPFVVDWQQHLDSYREAPPGTGFACIYDGVDHYFGGVIGRTDPAATPAMKAQLARFVELSVRFMAQAAAGSAGDFDQADLAVYCDRFLARPPE